MIRIALLVLGFVLCLQPMTVLAQNGVTAPSNGNPIPPAQSLQPTPSACSAGSQSVRVCNDDFRSCSSVCTATALDVNADVAGCSARCCSNFKACLNIRRCDASSINCF